MSVRIERTGPVAPLTPRFTRFLVEALGGVSMDAVQPSEQRRIDYTCLRGLLAIEIKSLEEDASERIENATAELRQQEDWPEFYGSWPMNSIIAHLGAPETAKRKLADRIGRAIVTHLSKADKQLGAHAVAFPRQNRVRLVVLINEDHEVYDPAMTAYILQRALQQMKGDVPRFSNIDAVTYITERHATKAGDDIAFPIITITGQPADHSEWKGKVLDYVARKWSQWTDSRFITAGHLGAEDILRSFGTIEDVPDKLRRQDLWRLQYRRAPYMRNWSAEKVKDRWDEVVVRGLFAFIKDAPFRLPRAETAKDMERISHLLEEFAHRAIPVSALPKERARWVAAAVRLGLDQPSINWVASYFDGPASPN